MKAPRFAALVLGLLAAGLLAGCLPSLHPIFEKDDIAYDAALEGSWVEKTDGEGDILWTFAPGEEKAYALTIGQEKSSSSVVAHLTRIAGHEFLDLWPDPKSMEELPRGDWFRAMLIPGHFFLRVSREDGVVKLRMLDLDWLEEVLKADPAALKIESMNPGGSCVTASTKELRAFLAKHGGNDKAWSKEGPDLRKKP